MKNRYPTAIGHTASFNSHSSIRHFLFLFLGVLLFQPAFSQSGARLDQWQKIDAAWEYGNLNKKHSNYTEGESVPYRIFIKGLTPEVQTELILSFDITGTSPSPIKHGIDYLTSFNATVGDPPLDDATVLGDVPAGFTVPAGPTDIKSIPAPANLSFLGGASQGNMILIGGTIDEIVYTDEGDPSLKNEAAFIRVKYTPAAGVTDVLFLFGGHLAREEDYDGNGDNDFTNDDDGAGGIHGSPYHMRLASITGNQDRSVKVGLANNCEVPDDCDDDLYKCEQLLNGNGTTPAAYFDLTDASCSVASTEWYSDADFTQPITDPENYLGHDGDEVYGKIIEEGNDCGFGIAVVTLHVYPLPTVDCPDDFSVCINDAAFALTGATPSGGTYSGTGVSNGNFDPATAGVGQHTITYTYSDGNSCSNSCSFVITVDPIPTFGTITPYPTCAGTNNGSITLSSCQEGVSYQLQTCSGYNRQDPKTCSNGSVTWTGLATGSYKIVATNTTTECSNTSGCVTVVGAVCNNTLTQGFYGNFGGKDCNNKTALDIMIPAVGASNKLFGNGCKSFTLKPSDLTGGSGAKIFKMLPGGVTPYVLGCVPSSGSPASNCLNTQGGTATYDCDKSWPYVPIQASGSKKGSIDNVLLAQTMTMFFNLYNSPTLSTVQLTGNRLTFNLLACGSSTPGAYASTQYIPCTVLNYLSNTGNYASPTIANLYDMANKVLGGVITTISASDMNAALNAINVGFDKGKALVNQELVNCVLTTSSRSSQLMTEVVPQITDLTVSTYPNPFNNKINFVITSGITGNASLEIYNVAGQKVKSVFQGHVEAGQSRYVTVDFPSAAATSMLIYRLSVGHQQVTGKLLQVKQ